VRTAREPSRAGAAHLAHQSDEWCDIERIEEAQRIYERLIANWCGLQ
jgi:succinyl-diaminopimelate desuccinylase